MLEQQLVDAYRGRSMVEGSELYLRVPDVIEFIEHCQQKNLAVLGIEGFVFDCGTLTPRPDLIADYSSSGQYSNWNDYRDAVNKDALEFVRSMSPSGDIVVSIEVWSEAEWAARNPQPTP